MSGSASCGKCVSRPRRDCSRRRRRPAPSARPRDSGPRGRRRYWRRRRRRSSPRCVSSPSRRNAIALPVAIGMLAPTMAFETIAPTEKSARCIWPPLPPTQPVALPQISAVMAFERCALGDQMADRTVGAVDQVVAAQRRADADRHRLLTLALMERAGHDAPAGRAGRGAPRSAGSAPSWQTRRSAAPPAGRRSGASARCTTVPGRAAATRSTVRSVTCARAARRCRGSQRRRFVDRLVGGVGQPGDDIARRPSLPAAATMRRRCPPRKASTSTVDLSVSTVRSTSPGANGRPFGDVPLDDRHVAAGRAEMRDDDRMLHDGCPLPALPKSLISRSTSACMARRPATSTSCARPEPIAS